MSAAGGDVVNVEDVFSVDLWTGNGSTTTITNGLDLSTEGGLMWIKARNSVAGSYTEHNLIDTERGNTSVLYSNRNYYANQQGAERVYQINTDGFAVDTYGYLNVNNQKYCAWSFRKAPKFFDVVKYTGNNESGQYVNHNLGVTPGMIILKSVTSAGNWYVWHRGLSSTSYAVRLNKTQAQSIDSNYEIGINASATQIYIDTGSEINYGGSSDEYIAYLFAHNNGDGQFGFTGDQDIIKCGSYTGNGNGEYDDNANEVNLGWEPQWIMVFPYTWGSGRLNIYDTTRGICSRKDTTNRDLQQGEWYLQANENNTDGQGGFLRVTPRGFKPETDNYAVNGNGLGYMYVAIRKPMATPEDVSKIFSVSAYTSDGTNGRVVNSNPSNPDLILNVNRDGNNTSVMYDRLRGPRHELSLRLTSAEAPPASNEGVTLDTSSGVVVNNGGYYDYPNYGTEKQVLYAWKRGTGYFDINTYYGNSSVNTIDHNLGVVPEMIWIKNRKQSTRNWFVYHAGTTGITKYLELDNSQAVQNFSTWANSTSPTSTQFTVNTGFANINNSGDAYVAYLFASLDGISKVGTYTGNGSSQTIDCGFSNGAQFVLIKRTSSSGQWYVWDSSRGIVAGNDPWNALNLSNAENSSYDDLDPHNSGFIVNDTGGAVVNTSSETYMFYAVAAP